MNKISFLLSIILLSAVTVNAQKKYEWESYGIGFEVVTDFKIVENSDETFELVSSDNELFISVIPWSDSSATIDDLEETTYWKAVDFVFGEGTNLKSDCMKIGELDACYVIGAVNDMDWDYYLVALMLDAVGETNIQVAIAYNEGDKDVVLEIMNNFYTYD